MKPLDRTRPVPPGWLRRTIPGRMGARLRYALGKAHEDGDRILEENNV